MNNFITKNIFMVVALTFCLMHNPIQSMEENDKALAQPPKRKQKDSDVVSGVVAKTLDENKHQFKRLKRPSTDSEDSDSSSSSDSSPSSSEDSDFSSSSDSSSSPSDSESDSGKQPQTKTAQLMNLLETEKAPIRKVLMKKTGLSYPILKTYISRFRKEGSMPPSADQILQAESQESRDKLKWYDQVAEKIKEKQPLEEILDYCAFKGTPKAQKECLNKIISKYYKKGSLTFQDTLYLKQDTTVVAGKGDTKEKILAFLEERSQGTPTKTIKDLVWKFNASPYKPARPIADGTFREHVGNMLRKGSKYYDPRIEPCRSFYEACKNPYRFTRK